MILFALIEFATKLRNLTFMSLAALFLFLGEYDNLTADPVAPDAFRQMDKFFRSTYVHARQQILRDTGPVIFAQDEDLTLFYDERGDWVGSRFPVRGEVATMLLDKESESINALWEYLD